MSYEKGKQRKKTGIILLSSFIYLVFTGFVLAFFIKYLPSTITIFELPFPIIYLIFGMFVIIWGYIVLKIKRRWER